MQQRRIRRWAVLAAGIGCIAVAVLGTSAAGASVSLNVPCSGGGGGATGLIGAVNTANAGGGGSINLAGGCTYHLTIRNNMADGGNGLPVVTSAITVNGNGATIAGNHTNFRIFDVAGGEGGSLTLNALTVTGGKTPGPGGGIFNLEGTLTLNHSVVTGNTAGGGGGGIATGTGNIGPIGVATLNNSQVTWNTVESEGGGGGGGGILNHAGTLTVNSSEISHNTAPGGGGIAGGPGNGNTGGSSLVTINKSIVSDNTATGGPFGGGGGIANGGMLVANNSLVTGNTAPGGPGAGILNHADATLNKTVVSGNTAPNDGIGDDGLGGGIANANFGFVPGAPSPTLLVNNSVITGNSASGEAGGIANVGFETSTLGTVTLHHTDVSANNPDNCFPSIAGCTG